MKKGFTLIEVLIGVLLFLILLGLAYDLLFVGVKSSSKGLTLSQAQENTRTALDRVAGELRQATLLPVQNTGQFASPVILPSPYNVAGAAGTNNTMIFAEVRTPPPFPDNLDSTQNFAYVVYKARQNTLQRLVYTVDQPGLVTLISNEKNWGEANILTFFNAKAPEQAPANILSLPRPEDTVSFTISHPLLPAGHIDTTTLGISFDRAFFNLNLSLVQYDQEGLRKATAGDRADPEKLKQVAKPAMINLTSRVQIQGSSF